MAVSLPNQEGKVLPSGGLGYPSVLSVHTSFLTSHRYLIGEEGYCLTSLQSALSYVELLSRGRLDK